MKLLHDRWKVRSLSLSLSLELGLAWHGSRYGHRYFNCVAGWQGREILAISPQPVAISPHFSHHCKRLTDLVWETVDQCSPLSLVQECRSFAIIGREDHTVAPALLCHKEPVPIIGPFSTRKPPIPYAIKNQRGASKIPPDAKYQNTPQATSLFFIA